MLRERGAVGSDGTKGSQRTQGASNEHSNSSASGEAPRASLSLKLLDRSEINNEERSSRTVLTEPSDGSNKVLVRQNMFKQARAYMLGDLRPTLTLTIMLYFSHGSVVKSTI